MGSIDGRKYNRKSDSKHAESRYCVRSIKCQFPKWAFFSRANDWFIDPKRSGGGCIRDHIVHDLDLCRWFSGQEPVQVYAEAATLASPNLPVEDTGILLVEFEDGLVGTIDPSWNRPRTWTRWGDVTMRLTGTKGTIQGDLTAQVISCTTDRTRWIPYDENMNTYLLKDFATKVLAGQPPLVTGEDGLAGVALTMAAYQSIATHLPVQVA